MEFCNGTFISLKKNFLCYKTWKNDCATRSPDSRAIANPRCASLHQKQHNNIAIRFFFVFKRILQNNSDWYQKEISLLRIRLLVYVMQLQDFFRKWYIYINYFVKNKGYIYIYIKRIMITRKNKNFPIKIRSKLCNISVETSWENQPNMRTIKYKIHWQACEVSRLAIIWLHNAVRNNRWFIFSRNELVKWHLNFSAFSVRHCFNTYTYKHINSHTYEE